MTDELSIQQQRPSALPYVGIGGAVAGTAGYFGLPKIEAVRKWMSEPAKYGSYADLINEKEDEFKKSVEAAEGEEKTLMGKAQKARQAGKEAGAKYDADLKNYLESNKAGATPELPADNDAIKAYNLKRQELIDKEIERLTKSSSSGEKTISQQKILKAKAEKIYRATTEAQRKEAMAELDKVCNTLVEKYVYEGDAEAVKTAKEALKKELKAHVEEMVALEDIYRANPTQPKMVTDYLTHKNQLSKLKTEIETATTKLGKVTGLDVSHYVVEDRVDPMLNNRLRSISTCEKAMVDTLEELKTIYSKTPEKRVLSLKERLITLLTGEVPAGSGESRLNRFIKKLTPEQKEQLSKFLKDGELSEKFFDDAIKVHNDKIASIKNSVDTIFENQDKIYGKTGIKKTLDSDLVKIRAKYGDGSYVNKEGILCKADGTAVNKEARKKPSAIKLPKGVTEPKGGVSLERTVTVLSKEEIAEQAAKNIDAKASELLKAEKEAIENARAALPKNPGKTAEQLTKEFVEKNGTRESVIEKATDGFKDDLKKLFEGKLGKGKLAMAVGGAVAAGALLGLAFRPSSSEV